MLKYRKGELGENTLIVELINDSFSDVRQNPDFQKSMPKVYKKEGLEYLTQVCLNNNKMIGSLTVFPTKFLLNDKIFLNAAYIGSVSVKSKYRNQGIMSHLLKSNLDEIKHNNYDFAILSGQRQRYGYFEFYPFGFMYDFLYTSQNIKHRVNSIKSDNFQYSYRLLKDDTDPVLDQMYDLYNKKLILGRPQKRFLDYLQSRSLNVYIITNQNNQFEGYILLRHGREIHEIELINFDNLETVLASFNNYLKLNELNIVILSYELDKFSRLNQFCESYKTYQTELVHVINYENTIKKMLELTNQVRKLDEGYLLIEIIDYGVLEIKVNSQIEVRKVNHHAEIKLTKEEVASLTLVHANCILSFKNWFPLLFSVALADTF